MSNFPRNCYVAGNPRKTKSPSEFWGLFPHLKIDKYFYHILTLNLKVAVFFRKKFPLFSSLFPLRNHDIRRSHLIRFFEKRRRRCGYYSCGYSPYIRRRGICKIRFRGISKRSDDLLGIIPFFFLDLGNSEVGIYKRKQEGN